MMAYLDLHIHSALSPCADNEMTPNNIVNMSLIKGLHIIAVTDHNSVENCDAIMKCASRAGIIAIPGMEIETSEEVHMICLFPGISEALAMQEVVYSALPNLENREDIFGQQIVMDENDNQIRTLKRLLLTPSNIGIEEVFRRVNQLGGIVIPAHIDRDSYSIISNLGSVPCDLGIKCLEISKLCDKEKYLENNPRLKDYRIIRNSDAHSLGNILEQDSGIDIEELSIECIIETLKL